MIMKLNALVKRGALAVLFVLFCGLGTMTFAANDYAPLVGKETLGVAKVDLTQLDFPKLTKQICDIAKDYLVIFVPEKEERDQIQKALPMMVAMFTAQYAGMIEDFKAEGVSTFYIIFTPDQMEISPWFLAIPVPNKTKDETQGLRDLCSSLEDLNIDVRSPFFRHGFVIAPYAASGVEDSEIKAYIRDKFTKLNPVAKPVLEEELAKGDGNLLTFVTLADEKKTEEIIASLKESGLASLDSKEELVEQFDKHLADLIKPMFKDIVSTSYHLNTNNLAFEINIQMKSSTDTAHLAIAFEKFLDESLKEVEDQAVIDVLAKNRELILPKLDGQYIRWRFDRQFLEVYRDVFIKLIMMAQGN